MAAGFGSGEVDGEHLGNPHHPISDESGRLGCRQDEHEVVDVGVRGLEWPRGHGAATPVAGLGPEDRTQILSVASDDVSDARLGVLLAGHLEARVERLLVSRQHVQPIGLVPHDQRSRGADGPGEDPDEAAGHLVELRAGCQQSCERAGWRPAGAVTPASARRVGHGGLRRAVVVLLRHDPSPRSLSSGEPLADGERSPRTILRNQQPEDRSRKGGRRGGPASALVRGRASIGRSRSARPRHLTAR